jgi:myo-inositol 2-dehydrogenase/D-chiro-inositol 1-dehydrogenase
MLFNLVLSRYVEAYDTETEAFCKSFIENTLVPCTGTDGLVALVMLLAADKLAAKGW